MVISAVETKRRGSAGNVNADALERIKFFADACAVRIFHLPVFAQRFFGESRDVLFRFRNRRAERFVRLDRSREQFRLRHGELLGGKFRAVEFFREFQHRVIAAHKNVMQDGARPVFNFGVEQAGGGGRFAEFGGKILVGVADNFHRVRVRQIGAAKSKLRMHFSPNLCLSVVHLWLKKEIQSSPRWTCRRPEQALKLARTNRARRRRVQDRQRTFHRRRAGHREKNPRDRRDAFFSI